MSLFSRSLASAKAPPRLTVIDIERKLADAERAIPELDRVHQQCALDAACDVEGSSQALIDAVLALQTGHSRVRDLRAALAAVREQEAERDAVAKAKLRDIQTKSCLQHLGHCESAFEKLAAAFDLIEAHWFQAIEAHEKAEAAWPIGTPRPDGTFFTADELLTTIGKQLHRAAGQPADRIELGGHRLAFPGSTADATEMHDPKRIPALMETVRSRFALIRERLRRSGGAVAKGGE